MSRAFWSEAHYLTNRNITLGDRFKRYSIAISPIASHSCGTWTWSQSLMRKLSAFELSLHRRIMPIKKLADETWLSYWRRSSKSIRDKYIALGYTPLFEIVLRRILSLSVCVSPLRNLIAPDAPVVIDLSNAITWRCTTWWQTVQSIATESNTPAPEWKHDSTFRNRGLLWDSVLVKTLGDDWLNLCSTLDPKDPLTKSNFVLNAMQAVKLNRPSQAALWVNHQNNSSPPAQRPKKARTVEPLPDTPNVYGTPSAPAVSFFGDSQLVINLVNGNALCKGYLTKYIGAMQVNLYDTWLTNNVVSASNHQWLHHIYRENNSIADAIADIAAKHNRIDWQINDSSLINVTAIKFMFDGSAGKSTMGFVPASGVALFVARGQYGVWMQSAHLSVPLPPASTSMFAETISALLAILLARWILTKSSFPTTDQINELIAFHEIW